MSHGFSIWLAWYAWFLVMLSSERCAKKLQAKGRKVFLGFLQQLHPGLKEHLEKKSSPALAEQGWMDWNGWVCWVRNDMNALHIFFGVSLWKKNQFWCKKTSASLWEGVPYFQDDPHMLQWGTPRRKKMSVVTGMITLIVLEICRYFWINQGGFPCIPPLLDQPQPTNQTNIQQI